MERLERVCPLDLVPKARDMLGAFLFRGDDVFKSIDVLSGGEKSRIALLELLLKPVNLLVLDEPTNHLDMHSKDVLLQAIKDFGGTCVFVSHDRGFIEDLSTRVLELHPGKWRIFPGDYKYYMQRLQDEEEGIVSVPSNFAVEKKEDEGQKKTQTKLSWEEQKKAGAERRKIEKLVQKLEEQISLVESQKAELEASLATPEVYSNGEKAKEVQEKISLAEKELEELNLRWEEEAEKLG